MKLIIAGGRNYELTQNDILLLDQIPAKEIVSGCASGADRSGEDYAKSRGLKLTKFPADWESHGRAAGPMRNRQMAEYADGVALFPGGRGTKSMAREAIKAKIPILVDRSNESN